jgi:hypothetical protein
MSIWALELVTDHSAFLECQPQTKLNNQRDCARGQEAQRSPRRACCSLHGSQEMGHGRGGYQPPQAIHPKVAMIAFSLPATRASRTAWKRRPVRRIEGVEKAEAILLRGQAIHPKNALIAFSLACYASVTARIEEAKARLRHAIDLDKVLRRSQAARARWVGKPKGRCLRNYLPQRPLL